MNKTLETQFTKLKDKISQSRRILITMSPPDGDAVGSALAVYNELKKLGKEVVVQSSFEMPRYLKFLPFASFIVIDDIGRVDFSKFDMVMLVDSGDASRVVKYSIYPDGWKFPPEVFLVSFDHHSTHEADFASIDMVDTKYASTCQLVFDYFNFAGIDYDKDSATMLYTGMYTDTGGFMHSNSTPEAYRAAADVIEKGADRELVILNVEKSQSMESMILAAEAMKTMELVQEDGYTYVLVMMNKNLLDQYDSAVIEDALNILKSSPGFIRNVDGTDFGVILTQNKDIVSVSFRARTERFNLAQICEKFGGGGHRNACAFKSRQPIDDAVTTLKEQIRLTL